MVYILEPDPNHRGKYQLRYDGTDVFYKNGLDNKEQAIEFAKEHAEPLKDITITDGYDIIYKTK